MVFVAGTASAQNVAKVGSTEYATIEEAVADWGPGKTLTLLANVTTTSTVTVEVNATKSTSNWELNLGDYTWTANGCNAFKLYAAGGTVMAQNYGLKIYANQNGGITASGKYCIECTYDNTSAGYRPRLEIHGGTYNGSYVVYYFSSQWNNTSISNGPSTWFYKSNDGTEPIFNGNLGLFKCPIYLYAGYFNGTSFNTYPVSSTANTNLNGGHFKTISTFPSAGNNKGIIFGNYKVFVRSDESIDVINGAPATYEAKATKTLLLSSNQGVNYSDYVYYEKADDAINKYSSSTIEIILSEGVTATQDKSFRSGTLTIDASAEGSAYTGNITLTGNNAKFIIKFPEGQGHYGVSASTGNLHVVETVTNGIVTRTYSVISNVTDPEASVGSTNYSTVYDAFYAIDGTTDNQTIVLQKDVTNVGIVTNGTATGGDGKTVATFDLNGKSIGIGSVYAGNNADYTLTIIDSSEGKTGTVTNSDASLLLLAITSLNDYSGTYTLKVQAGTWSFDPSKATVNGVTRNLVDEGYESRDNGNGTWTVGEIIPVAQIVGGAKYATLQAAVNAAQALGGSQTITLLDNISGETVTINEVANFKLTIDGQKDASSNYTVDALIIVDGLRGSTGSTTNGASVTIQNIAFVKTTATDGIQASHYPHNLTIQDCTYIGSDNNKWFLNASTDGPLYGVTVKNVTVENARLIYGNLADDAVFQNITATNNCTVGFNVKTSGTALIENCQVTTAKYAFRDYSDDYAGTFTLKDNTFVSTSEESDEGVIVNRAGAVGSAHINVESGTYTGHVKVLNGKKGVLQISGGYFSEEFPQEYIAADLVAQGKVCVPATDKEGFFTIGDPHYVAQIGETGYVSLQAAVDAAYAMTGDVTIELLDNIDGYSIVHQKSGLNVTIDGKDKTVAGQIFIDGNGRASGTETLTIQNIKFEGNTSNFYSGTDAFILIPSTKDTGKPWSVDNQYNYAHNITVTDCSFTSTSTSEEYDVVCIKSTSGAGAYNVVISNCTASGTMMHSLAQLIGTTGGAVTNCTVTGSESFVNVNGGGGNFTISGNTFTSAEGANGYGVRENGTSTAVITLTDNTFTAANAVVLGKTTAVTAGTINVESGTYVGEISKTAAATGKIVISGGQFSADLTDTTYEPFIAEGKIGVQNNAVENAPYSVEEGTHVAQVTLGESTHKYGSLEAAMAAAKDGATVTLLADCAGNGIVVPQGKYTTGLIVDFNEKTYTVDGETVGSAGTETNGFQLLKGNKITFKNGTITSEKAKILVQNYSDLTLEGMTLTLNNPNYTSAYTLSNNNGTVVIDGSTINANPAGGFAFDVCRYASYESVSVTVKGESVINGNVEVYASDNSAGNGFTLMLESGTLNGNIVIDATAGAAMAATPEKGIIRKNDTFDQAAPAGYMWVSDGEGTGTSTLAPRPYVAQIGDTKYWSLADAVAAVPADGTETTIVMIDNETFNNNLSVTISANQNIILDLNGKTVSQNAPDANVSALITNNGTLTIKDSSDTNKDGTGTGKMYSEAAQPSSSYGYATNLISNRGNLTIESGYLESHSRYASYVVDNYPGGNAIINGGHLYNYFTSAIRLFCNSTTAEDNVTVNGGIVEGYCTIWVQSSNNNANKGNLTINGGTFKTTEKAVVNGEKAIYEGSSYLYMYPSNENMSITITGGTFDTNIATWGDGHVSISGGIFNGYVYSESQEGFITGGVYALEIDEEYIHEGYIPTANTDEATKETNPYTVKVGQFVAQIGNKKYESVADAIDDVPTDGTETTITLLVDDTEEGDVIQYNKNIILDLDGHTLTMDFAQFDSNFVIKNGTLAGSIWVYGYNDERTTHFTLDESATITADYGIVLEQLGGGTANGITVDINGTVNGIVWVMGNITAGNSVINVNEGASIVGESVGIALNGFATLNVNGGSITGVNESGIEVRAGHLVVNGGTITSLFEGDFATASNGSGTTTAGPAITVAQHTTHLATTVEVLGGTLVAQGDNPLIAVVDPEGGNLEGVTVTVKDEFTTNSYIPEDYKWVAAETEGMSTLAPKVYVAQNVDTNKKYESLAEAVAAAETGQTIQMTDDSNETRTTVVDKAITIDLNGKTVTREGVAMNVKADLTVTDSSENGGGNIQATGNGGRGAQVLNGATITLDKVTVNGGQLGVLIQDGHIALNEGSILTANSYALYSYDKATNSAEINGNSTVTGGVCGVVMNMGDLTLNSGTVSNTGASGQAVYVNGDGTFTMNGGSISSASEAIRIQSGDAKLVINGGTVESEKWAVVNFGTFTMNDGTIQSNGIGICNHGEIDAPGTNITIHGGTINANIGIYHPGMGNLTIDGGTLTASTGVVMRNGKLDISGGTIHATGEANAYDFHSSGSSDTGDAVQIERSNYGEHIGETFNGSTYSGTIVSITSGIFISDNAQAVASYINSDDATQTSDGTERAENFITGGWFSNVVPENYCGEGLIPDLTQHSDAPNEAAPYTVKTGVYVAQIGNVKYETLEEAIAAATEGANEILVLADCEGNGISINKDVTIDFDNHTYTIVGPGLAGSTGTQTQGFQLLKGNTIVFKNGTLVGNNADVKMLIQNYADLTLDNMTLDATQGNNSIEYVLSTNNGNTTINDTKIVAKDGGIAFDVCTGWGGYTSNNVTVTGDSDITGPIEVSFYGTGTAPTLMLAGGTHNGGEIVMADGADQATVMKNNTYEQDAPADYKWRDNGDGTSTLVPCEYVAQIGSVKYESLADAVAAVQANETIEMIAETTETAAIDISNKTFTLDLNGQVVNLTAADAFTGSGANWTIKDSSDTNADGTGTGKINATGNYEIADVSNSTITVESGLLESSGRYGIFYTTNTTVNVTGGKMVDSHDANRYMLTVAGANGVLNFTGGSMYHEAGSGIQILSGATVNISDDAYISCKKNAVTLFESKDNEAGKTLNVTGGTIISTEGTAISTNGTHACPNEINISGGEITAYYAAIYNPNGGTTVNVTDGTLTGGTGIAVKGGTVNVSGGTITANGAFGEAHAASSGYSDTGDAIYVEDTYGANYHPTVNITGGTLTSANGYAAQYWTNQTDATLAAGGINISDGILIGASGKDAVTAGLPEGLDKQAIEISGGWFSTVVAEEYCADEVKPDTEAHADAPNASAQYTVKAREYVAQVDDTKYETLEEAFAAISAGGSTLTLLDNVEMTDNFTASASFTLTTGDYTLDSNGHNIVLNYGVSVTTDEQNANLFAPSDAAYIVKEETVSGGYKYTCMTKEEGGIFELLDLAGDNNHPYKFTTTRHAESITYRRSFTSNQTGTYTDQTDGITNKRYQCWFVPFDYTITSDDLDNLEFFKIHLIAASATAGEVQYNKKTVYIYLEKLSAGDTMYGNRPYVVWVKNSSKLEFVFTVEDTDLLAINKTSRLDVSTSEDRFDFFGVYQYGATGKSNAFSLNNAGRYVWMNPSDKLRAYRWCVQATSRVENTNYADMFIFNVEEGEPTDIDGLNITQDNEIEGVYTIDGKKLDHPMKGLNIIKMKDNTVQKVYIK